MCSCDQGLVTVAFLWEKLSQLQFYKDLTWKTAFLGVVLVQIQYMGLTLVTNLKFYTSVAKGLKLRVRKFWGLIHNFVEVTQEKLVGGEAFCSTCPPMLSRVKSTNIHTWQVIIFSHGQALFLFQYNFNINY